VQLKVLAGLKTAGGSDDDKKAYDELAGELRAAWPEHLPLRAEALKRAGADVKPPHEKTEGSAIEAALEAADKACLAAVFLCPVLCAPLANRTPAGLSQQHANGIYRVLAAEVERGRAGSTSARAATTAAV
jgi:hypothetical protein